MTFILQSINIKILKAKSHATTLSLFRNNTSGKKIHGKENLF